MTMRNYRAAAFILPLAVAILAAPPLNAQAKEFSKWPARSSPKEIGERLAERFVATLHTNFGQSAPPSFITYPESVAWYGGLTFAQLSGDKDLSFAPGAAFRALVRRGIQNWFRNRPMST